MKKKVVVIGGGIGGLSAAVRLQAAGIDVTILEKNARLGGKLNLWIAPHPDRPNERPFRFDTGPSLLTMPYVLMDLFAAAGRDVRDHLRITRLDPVSRFVWSDGATLDLRSDEQELRAELARFAPKDAPGAMRLLQRGRRIWDLAQGFVSSDPQQLLRGGKLGAIRLVSLPFRIGMFRRYARAVDRAVADPRLRAVFHQYATYTGTSPSRATAMLLCIPWVEHYFGGWHIQGGMYRLAEELEAVAQELGVTIRLACPVDEICIDSTNPVPRAVAVRTADGSRIPADAVVVNCDAAYAYRKLIPEKHRPRFTNERLSRYEPGGSGMAIMLGIDGTYPHLAHHTKFMPDDYGRELRDMFETHTLSDDPCIYVCRPTHTDASVAPDGCDNLFVLVSAASIQKDSRIDWPSEAKRYRDRVIQKLEQKCGLKDLSRRIVVERIISPLDMQQIYNANAGSIYGIAGGSLRESVTRPGNRDSSVRGLYFAGAATHPGGGIPMVALSGKIVSEMILSDPEFATRPS